MGYSMRQTDSSFFILNSCFAELLETMFNRYSKVIPEGESRIKLLEKEFGRWKIHFDVQDNIDKISFEGENLWDEYKFLQNIAAFVRDGSYIEMCGEDGDLWRWIFNNGECKEKSAKVVWE